MRIFRLPCAERGPGPGRTGVARRSRREQGQTLVEFSLVIPLFLLVLLSIVEFAFTFNAVLSAQYASRDAALVAAEAGNAIGSDCVILATVEQDMGAPTDRNEIQTVEIYRTSAAGQQIGSATVYTRDGSTTCVLPDGSTQAVPYRQTANGYPEADRCNTLAGCGDPVPSTRPLDHVGVRVTYHHYYKTPIGSGFGTYLEVIRSNSMRMEPVL